VRDFLPVFTPEKTRKEKNHERGPAGKRARKKVVGSGSVKNIEVREIRRGESYK